MTNLDSSQDTGHYNSGRRIGAITEYYQNDLSLPFHESYSAAPAMGCSAKTVKENHLFLKDLCSLDEHDISYGPEHSKGSDSFVTRSIDRGEISSQRRCSSFTTESSGDDNQVEESHHLP